MKELRVYLESKGVPIGEGEMKGVKHIYFKDSFNINGTEGIITLSEKSLNFLEVIDQE